MAEELFNESQVAELIPKLSPQGKRVVLQALLPHLAELGELPPETLDQLRRLSRYDQQAATPPAASSVEADEVRAATRRARRKKGLVIVNTGNGKGKSTAAFGVLLRAWGRAMKTGVIQFIKNENARYGEIKAAERMGNIDWLSSGDGFTWISRNMEETEARARHGWEMAQARIAGGQYNLLILDEFTYPLHYGWLDTHQVIEWLKANKPPMLHLIITGRYAPAELIAYADLVTEMREIKHPFKEQGIRAQPGIEY
jgi:cob(I)alamin adenosyltransferase